ncbi:malonate decarboxylase holo-[acyl-carrier-protein] synthase [Candidatus Avoscillospira sp. LCP25S3_F1]|uniref:malonate decarboxylase holo-[acyl-carrier-protein] synthase n=1 Tax=Candidatus Avoscillospira sp. LCP25S3_F1 TaxID=3438825 RepID=UPI003F8E3054
MIPQPHRHDLVFLSPLGHQYAWTHRTAPKPEDDALQEMFTELPGICRVRPPELSDDLTALGFSFPIRIDGNRVRIATQGLLQEITKVLTPWEIPQWLPTLPAPAGPALLELAEAAANYDIPFGVFGSAALQAVTGRSYLHQHSDLDVVIGAAPRDSIQKFYQCLTQTSERTALHIDAELMLNDTCYVKLHELMRDQKTILAKGAYLPQLLPCQEIWDTIATLS